MRSITDSDSKLLRNRLTLPDYFTFGPLLQLWSVLKLSFGYCHVRKPVDDTKVTVSIFYIQPVEWVRQGSGISLSYIIVPEICNKIGSEHNRSPLRDKEK